MADTSPQQGPKGRQRVVKAVYCRLAYQLLRRVHQRNAGLDEAQAGIKIAGRNTNNLRYADDTTLMAERQEELKSLLMKLKEESRIAGLNNQHSKNEVYDIQRHHFMANGEIMETVRNFIFLGSKITADGDCSHEIKRCLLL